MSLQTKKSNLFLSRNSKIIQGNSLKVLDLFPSKSVQTVITSPPYWGFRDYKIDGQMGLEKSLGKYIKNLLTIFKSIKRILKDDGTIWINIGDGYTSGNRKYRTTDKKYNARGMQKRPDNPRGLKNKDLLCIPWRLAMALQKDGWYLRTDIIWKKRNGMPESVKDRPSRNHEYLFLLSKSEYYYFNKKALADESGKKRRSVWEVSTKSNGHHSAAFPSDLITPCILASTKYNDWVLDPFFGSGTIGIVCEQKKRRYIGIEIHPQYINIAKNRMNTPPELLNYSKKKLIKL